MPRRRDPQTKLDRAWLGEEHAEIETYAAAARLDHARAVVERRSGPGLGLDGSEPIGIPTPLMAAEHRALGAAAAELDEARAVLAYARIARRDARIDLDAKRNH